MRQRIAYLSLALSLLCACANSKKKQQSAVVDYTSIANQKLGNGVKFIENSDGDYVLCLRESKDLNDLNLKRYMVLEKSSGTVLVDVSKVSGSVTWFDDSKIKINPMNRVAPDKTTGNIDDNSYLIDVKTGKRIAGGQINK